MLRPGLRPEVVAPFGGSPADVSCPGLEAIIIRKREGFCDQIRLMDVLTEGLFSHRSSLGQRLELFGGKLIPHRVGKQIAHWLI